MSEDEKFDAVKLGRTSTIYDVLCEWFIDRPAGIDGKAPYCNLFLAREDEDGKEYESTWADLQGEFDLYDLAKRIYEVP